MMEKMTDIELFNKDFFSNLNGYELSYRFFENGDFGSLNQIEFNSKKIGGNVDFWGLGWLGIFVWNYEKKEQIFNVLIEPHEKEEKEKALRKLQDLLMGMG